MCKTKQTDKKMGIGSVDNNLGYFLKCLEFLGLSRDQKNGAELKPLESVTKTFYIENALQTANKAREFIDSIPYPDEEIPVIYDNVFGTNNKPQHHIYDELANLSVYRSEEDRVAKKEKQKEFVRQLLANPKESSPTGWYWERYKRDIWRLVPKTFADFYYSPIKNYLVECQSLISLYTHFSGDESLMFYCWFFVIQRIEKNHEVGKHNDYDPGRIASVIHYLTPDSWSPIDGGLLNFFENDHQTEIEPRFNKLIYSKMINAKCPTHSVSRVLSDRPRISLIGFACVS